MTYTKTNWQDGDVITAEKLNKLENGIKGNETSIENIPNNIYWIEPDLNDSTKINASYTDIIDAINAGKFPVLKIPQDSAITAIFSIGAFGENNGQYMVGFASGSYAMTTTSSTVNEHMTISQG